MRFVLESPAVRTAALPIEHPDKLLGHPDEFLGLGVQVSSLVGRAPAHRAGDPGSNLGL